MNSIHLAVSVRRSADYNPLELCTFIERWATSNSGQIRVSVDNRINSYSYDYEDRACSPELLFLKIDYDNYPTTGNYLIEINQFVKSAVGHFKGIECVGITAA